MNANYVLFYTIYFRDGGFSTKHEFFETVEEVQAFIFRKIEMYKNIEYRIFKGV